MRFDNLKIRGLGPFPTEVDLDLAAITGKLVAITGLNGAGKTTLLELLGGVVYRQCPTRGSLAGLATARDAYAEATVVNGKAWTIRQSIDSVSGKGEALVLDAQGLPALADSKVRTFDTWAKAHLPRPEVLYASTFAVQGGAGSFIDLKAADRKAVLLRALGIEHLETLAQAARDHARETRQRLAVIQARLEEQGQGTTLEDAEAAVASAEDLVTAAGLDVVRTADALEQAQAAAAQVAEARRQRDEEATRVADLRRQLTEAEKKVSDLEARVANNKAVLDRSAEIEAAVARDAELAERLAELATERAEVTEQLRAATHQGYDARRRWREAQDRARAAEARAERAKARLADRGRIEQAVAALPGLREEVARAERALTDAQAALEDTRGQRLAGAEERIGGLRSGLEMIASGDSGRPMLTAEAFLQADDDAVEQARALPAQVAERQAAVTAAQSELRGHRAALDTAERVAARAADLASAEEDLAAAQAEAQEADATAQAAEKEADAATGDEVAHRQALDEIDGRTGSLEKDRRGLAELVKLSGPLAQASARLEELEPQAATAQATVEDLRAALATRDELPEVPAEPDVAGARRASEEAHRAARESGARLAVAQRQVEEAQARAGRTEALATERREAEAEQADWTRLAADLGRDGLQALEIDAAGPELTEMVNDLLRECVGTRWTVRIDTTRSSADGKRQLEGLDVAVIDTERGREGLVETFSGGERVILGEAVSLALATLAARRAGLTGATLVRDESGAALDPANAGAYVRMLRRAADHIGARQVLLVSHSPDVQDLCDARIRVADGRVEVES